MPQISHIASPRPGRYFKITKGYVDTHAEGSIVHEDDLTALASAQEQPDRATAQAEREDRLNRLLDLRVIEQIDPNGFYDERPDLSHAMRSTSPPTLPHAEGIATSPEEVQGVLDRRGVPPTAPEANPRGGGARRATTVTRDEGTPRDESQPATTRTRIEPRTEGSSSAENPASGEGVSGMDGGTGDGTAATGPEGTGSEGGGAELPPER